MPAGRSHDVITMSATRITKFRTVRSRLAEDARTGHLDMSGRRGGFRALLDAIGKCRVCGADPVPGATCVSGGSKWFYCMPCAKAKRLV